MGDTTASLGIEVAVKGAKESQADLAGIDKQAKSTSASFKELGDSTDTLGRKMQGSVPQVKQFASPWQSFTDTTKDLGKQTTELGIQMGATVPLIRQFVQPWQDIAKSAPATVQSMTLTQRILSFFPSLFQSHANAAGQATAATTLFREGLHTVNPILSQFGGGMMGMERFSRAATAGIAGLAIAVTGVFLIAIEKTVEKLAQMRQSLVDLSPRGAQTFSELQAVAQKTGVDFANLVGAAVAFDKAMRSIQGGKFVFPNTPGGAEAATQLGFSPAKSLEAISIMLRLGKASSEAQKAVSDALAEMAKGDKLTLDIFDKIESSSPAVAKGIAAAFNFSSVEQFRSHLKLMPEDWRNFVTKVGNTGFLDDLREKFKLLPEDMQSSLGKLTMSWDKFAQEIGDSGIGTGAIDTIKMALDELTTYIKIAEADYKAFKALVKTGTDAVKNNTPNLNFLSGGLNTEPNTNQLNADKYLNSTTGGAGTQAEKATDSVNKLNDALNRVPEEINKIDNTKIAIDDSPITKFVTDANTDVSRIGSDVESIVSAVSNSVINMVRNAQAAINQLQSSGNAASGGGPSFTVNDNINQGSGDLPQFASGGLATVSGPAGTDKTLVQFMATNGEVVAIGAPGNASAVRAASGGSTGASVSAITTPITVAISSSTSQIVSALNNSAAQAANAMNSSVSSSSGGGGSVRIVPWKGNPAGTMSDYLPRSAIYGPDPYSASPTPDPVPYNYTPIQDIGGGGTVDPQNYAGAFASGGSIAVRGHGGTDSQRIALRASPGETINVSRNGAGGSGPVHLHFYAPMNAQSFVASQSQIKRAVQKAFR